MTVNFGDGRTMKQRMLAGELYHADDPELLAGAERAVRLQAEYNAAFPVDAERASGILAELLGSLGANVTVKAPLYVDYGSNITIGDGTFVNVGLVALDVTPITIGASCQIGPNVQLLTPTHPLDPEPRRAGYEAGAPITLGDNVWLGGGVIVCPGVTIGENTVVGAGAVVTKDLPANVVAVGNPARVIRSLD
ncbi:sugar O-acetyltransferase [Pseudoclavibacter sp. VKM Ac-2888]|uniref:sugar O-acetyltransferase n=1 Tax=Pseudoclavibacter sp. VKM Ac-2888 TaxID=2783830 RepID=UPI00188A250D|nr:sugar O-acetyltransferase [Pseudoclavibacter sp. VKM Ac-2888]MBF4550670.1 sugar O-acetyltransferase [Pseudoclavibacter sp. VKM Ac-2888]